VHTPEEAVLETKINQTRNRSINKNISFYSPYFLKLLQNYNQTLKQRNEALKTQTPTKFWDPLFIDLAEKIWLEKHKYEKEINEKISTKNNINEYNIKLEIRGKILNKETIKEELEKTKKKDLKRGFTGIGPHKDLIKYFLNDLEIKTTASQGEKTIFFSQLKKAEAEHIKTKNKEPIILLDDILSKLDDSNLEKIILLFKENTQTIITAANPIDVEKHKKLFLSTNINQININD
tara:strand:- start:1377 stop:2081 length:705 start_codon:yes stop_codon:yes gene_type:complete